MPTERIYEHENELRRYFRGEFITAPGVYSEVRIIKVQAHSPAPIWWLNNEYDQKSLWIVDYTLGQMDPDERSALRIAYGHGLVNESKDLASVQFSQLAIASKKLAALADKAREELIEAARGHAEYWRERAHRLGVEPGRADLGWQQTTARLDALAESKPTTAALEAELRELCRRAARDQDDSKRSNANAALRAINDECLARLKRAESAYTAHRRDVAKARDLLEKLRRQTNKQEFRRRWLEGT